MLKAIQIKLHLISCCIYMKVTNISSDYSATEMLNAPYPIESRPFTVKSVHYLLDRYFR